MKLRGVEAARGVAAVLVVTLHVTSILADPKQYGVKAFGGFFDFGRAGVDFFFVLSGFIIAYVHADDIGQPARILNYWRKRLWRIYPLYLVATLLWQGLLVLSPTRDRAEQDWGHILASWTLFPEPVQPILSVGWSLRHELVFYALFGVSLLNRAAGRAVMVGWGAIIGFNIVMILLGEASPFTGTAAMLVAHPFNIEFFFGMAIAGLLHRPAWHPARLAWAGVAVFLANGVLETFGPDLRQYWPLRHVTYALASAAILYGLATQDRTGRLAVPGWLVQIGTASYSIYLIHVLLALLTAYALRTAGLLRVLPIEMAFALLMAVAVGGGAVLSRLVEQPILSVSRGLVLSRRAARVT